jgi:hypothetical protein
MMVEARAGHGKKLVGAAIPKHVRIWGSVNEKGVVIEDGAVPIIEERAKGSDEALFVETLPRPKANGPCDKLKVNLKWALWSASEDYWNDYAPEALKTLKACVDGGKLRETKGSIVISTAPNKEIRYGTVVVYYDSAKRAYAADVRFCTEWDEIGILADALDVPEDEIDGLSETLPRHPDGIGVEVARTVRARSLTKLLAKIDDVESELLETDEAVWKETEDANKFRREQEGAGA